MWAYGDWEDVKGNKHTDVIYASRATVTGFANLVNQWLQSLQEALINGYAIECSQCWPLQLSTNHSYGV